MRTFADEPILVQEQASFEPSFSKPFTSTTNRPMHPLIGLERTLGNQAVLRMLRGSSVGLPMTSPGDEFEQEANRVAGQVLRQPDPFSASQRTLFPGGRPAADDGLLDAPPAVRQTLRSPGQPLDAGTRTLMEARFGQDFGGVRVHADAQAAESAQAVNARAFTVGSHIVFAPTLYAPTATLGQELLAHELTHVVQQSAPGAAPMLARQPNVTTPTKPSPVDEVIEDMKDSGPDGFFQASGVLLRLPMKDMLNVLLQLRARGAFDLFKAYHDIYTTSGVVQVSARLTAALYVVKWTGSDAGKESVDELQTAASTIGQLAQFEQKILLDYLAQSNPNAKQGMMAAETMTALKETETDQPVTVSLNTPPAIAGMGAGSYAPPPTIGPGPWNPPGKKPIPFYIGTEAHVAISLVYDEAHPGDQTFYNFIGMSTILRAAARMGQGPKVDALTDEQLAFEPDITNLTRHHLYEIKPVASQSLGRAEMLMYLAAFKAAGIPMAPGPTTEDGTTGVVPAPGGIYIFTSPEPGVIIYRYRKGAFVPVPVEQPEEASEPSEARWRYELKPYQKAAIAGTVTVGVGLIILMILAAPVGA